MRMNLFGGLSKTNKTESIKDHIKKYLAYQSRGHIKLKAAVEVDVRIKPTNGNYYVIFGTASAANSFTSHIFDINNKDFGALVGPLFRKKYAAITPIELKKYEEYAVILPIEKMNKFTSIIIMGKSQNLSM